jgi:hypothetical protein
MSETLNAATLALAALVFTIAAAIIGGKGRHGLAYLFLAFALACALAALGAVSRI